MDRHRLWRVSAITTTSSLVPDGRLGFSIAEYRRDPQIGLIDADYPVAARGVLPAGTQFELTTIDMSYDINTNTMIYDYRAKLTNGESSGRSVSVKSLLFSRAERIDNHAVLSE